MARSRMCACGALLLVWPGLLLPGVAAQTHRTGAQKDGTPTSGQQSGAPAPNEKLVWSDEFTSTARSSQPSSANWVFEEGGNGWGNHELEVYCAPGSNQTPCVASEPNAFVGDDGMLHVIARQAGDRFTSARLKTQGLKSFRYGRMEARIRMPGGRGIWPAFWMLGEDIAAGHPWPACGEIDIMESIGAREPDTVHGTLHGTGFPPAGLTGQSRLPTGMAFADAFHRFGMIWSPARIEFYVDDPSRPYAVFTAADVPKGGVWPFDGRRFFFLLNVAVGGDWPGPPDTTTRYPAEMQVDYVRVWQRAASR